MQVRAAFKTCKLRTKPSFAGNENRVFLGQYMFAYIKENGYYVFTTVTI